MSEIVTPGEVCVEEILAFILDQFSTDKDEDDL